MGTTAGPASENGLRGSISGCGADGRTNQVAYTFRPTVNAHLVIDAAKSSFDSVISLHEGALFVLPVNPSGADWVQLEGPSENVNDTFDTAIRIGGSDGFIDGDYLTYLGDLTQLTDSGDDAINTAEGVSGLADYEAPLLGCTSSSGGAHAVFEFRLAAALRLPRHALVL